MDTLAEATEPDGERDHAMFLRMLRTSGSPALLSAFL